MQSISGQRFTVHFYHYRASQTITVKLRISQFTCHGYQFPRNQVNCIRNAKIKPIHTDYEAHINLLLLNKITDSIPQSLICCSRSLPSIHWLMHNSTSPLPQFASTTQIKTCKVSSKLGWIIGGLSHILYFTVIIST